MLSKLHSEAESNQIDSQLDADGTTATLQDATQQLRGQHLSGTIAMGCSQVISGCRPLQCIRFVVLVKFAQ